MEYSLSITIILLLVLYSEHVRCGSSLQLESRYFDGFYQVSRLSYWADIPYSEPFQIIPGLVLGASRTLTIHNTMKGGLPTNGTKICQGSAVNLCTYSNSNWLFCTLNNAVNNFYSGPLDMNIKDCFFSAGFSTCSFQDRTVSSYMYGNRSNYLETTVITTPKITFGNVSVYKTVNYNIDELSSFSVERYSTSTASLYTYPLGNGMCCVFDTESMFNKNLITSMVQDIKIDCFNKNYSYVIVNPNCVPSPCPVGETGLSDDSVRVSGYILLYGDASYTEHYDTAVSEVNITLFNYSNIYTHFTVCIKHGGSNIPVTVACNNYVYDFVYKWSSGCVTYFMSECFGIDNVIVDSVIREYNIQPVNYSVFYQNLETNNDTSFNVSESDDNITSADSSMDTYISPFDRLKRWLAMPAGNWLAILLLIIGLTLSMLSLLCCHYSLPCRVRDEYARVGDSANDEIDTSSEVYWDSEEQVYKNRKTGEVQELHTGSRVKMTNAKPKQVQLDQDSIEMSTDESTEALIKQEFNSLTSGTSKPKNVFWSTSNKRV